MTVLLKKFILLYWLIKKRYIETINKKYFIIITLKYYNKEND